MDRTPFAGLTRLEPGESLSEDGYSFQSRNPAVIDALLRLAAVTHRHDEHAALRHADPPLDPIVTILPDGGTIPSDTEIHVGYTLVDQDGGETALNANVQIMATASGLATPQLAPTLAQSHASGSLLAGDYGYAATVTDGVGGETELGLDELITIDPGYPNSTITVSGLAAIVAAVGGVGWRLWRQVNGGLWNLLATGAADTVVDDGSLFPDCNVQPPEAGIGTGTTLGTSRLQVTVPAGQPSGAVTFRLYAAEDAAFGSPSLLGEYPLASAGVMQSYTTLDDVLPGSPPPVGTAIGGARRIDADTDLLNFHWKAPVATVGDLPTNVVNDIGDVRQVLADRSLHSWDGDSWEPVGGTGGGGQTIQDEGTALPARGVLDFVGAGVVATDDATNAKTIVTVTAGGGGPWISLTPYLTTNWSEYTPNPASFYQDGDRIWFRGFVMVNMFDDDPGDIIPGAGFESSAGGHPLEAVYRPPIDATFWTYDWRWTRFETNRWHIVTVGSALGQIGTGGMMLQTGVDTPELSRLSLEGFSYRLT